MPTPGATPPRHHPGLHTRARWLRLRFWLVTVGLGLIAAVAVLAAIVWWLVRTPPQWWTPRPEPTAQAREVGQELENAVVNHLHAQRQEAESWSVSISSQDANDWLATRLVKWLVNLDPSIDWKNALKQSLVEFQDGQIYIGASIAADPGADGQVISAILIPSIDPQGRLWLTAGSLSLGRLTLPISVFAGDGESLAMHAMPGDLEKSAQARRVIQALIGARPLADDPVATLADKRKVRLLAVASREGRLELTCRTESR